MIDRRWRRRVEEMERRARAAEQLLRDRLAMVAEVDRRLAEKAEEIERRLDEIDALDARVRRIELACQIAGTAMLNPVLAAADSTAAEAGGT